MAQINLLKQNTTKTQSPILEIVIWFLVLILIVIVGYWGWLFYSSSRLDSEIANTQKSLTSIQQTALSNPDRLNLLTRQQQIAQLKTLIGSHIYMSQILPRLAQVTLNTASYSSLKIDNAGLTLSASVPSLQDLDLYLQIFDLPDVNKYFSNVRISSFNKVQGKNSSSIQFQAIMQYNPAIVSYTSNLNSQ